MASDLREFSLTRTIRPFTAQDGDLVYSFFQQLSDHSRSLFHPHLFTRDVALELTVQDVENPETMRFMVTIKDQGTENMIGYFFFWDWNKSVPWFGIAVTDPFQGQGLGKTIMEYSIDFAKGHGKGGVLLTTHKTNVRAQALYKRYGFEILGDSVSGEYLLIHRFS